MINATNAIDIETLRAANYHAIKMLKVFSRSGRAMVKRPEGGPIHITLTLKGAYA